MIIAITGCIGSGKSAVARKLAALLDAEHCDTDQVCRDLLMKDAVGFQQVISTWGSRFQDDDGDIDRVKLRKAVFEDDDIRGKLEAILHPLVRLHVQQKAKQYSCVNRSLIVEIPLLFETGWQDDFDRIITVVAPAEECIRRVEERDNVSKEQVLKTLACQMDISLKARQSHYVVDNSGDFDETIKQVKALSQELR